MISMRTINVRVRFLVEPDDGRFHAYCPELKGLHVDGSTVDEAVSNAKDAAKAYLNSLLRHGDPIPVGVVTSDVTKTVGQIFGEFFHELCAKIFGHVTTRVEELSVGA